ncbi:MAG: hypothetical protein EWM73_02591 [Nitrospira sp.]|nr:MAG: hypothetical protein EWM73_02591 [Nitrospira sp.]
MRVRRQVLAVFRYIEVRMCAGLLLGQPFDHMEHGDGPVRLSREIHRESERLQCRRREVHRTQDPPEHDLLRHGRKCVRWHRQDRTGCFS